MPPFPTHETSIQCYHPWHCQTSCVLLCVLKLKDVLMLINPVITNWSKFNEEKEKKLESNVVSVVKFASNVSGCCATGSEIDLNFFGNMNKTHDCRRWPAAAGDQFYVFATDSFWSQGKKRLIQGFGFSGKTSPLKRAISTFGYWTALSDKHLALAWVASKSVASDFFSFVLKICTTKAYESKKRAFANIVLSLCWCKNTEVV